MPAVSSRVAELALSAALGGACVLALQAVVAGRRRRRERDGDGEDRILGRRTAPAALIVIDMQQGFDIETHWGGTRNNRTCEDQCLALLRAWRSRGWPVIHVRHASVEPGSPFALGSLRLSTFPGLGYHRREEGRESSLVVIVVLLVEPVVPR